MGGRDDSLGGKLARAVLPAAPMPSAYLTPQIKGAKQRSPSQSTLHPPSFPNQTQAALNAALPRELYPSDLGKSLRDKSPRKTDLLLECRATVMDSPTH